MTYTLAIETSCDDTSIAVIENKTNILSNRVSSQEKTHKRYGGVVPEVASRLHAETIHSLLDLSLKEASISLHQLSQIAVTIGPGLEGCLLVGISVAKSLSYALDIPLIPVHHIHGHIYAFTQYKPTLSYPALALIVSGGHTDLIVMEKEGSFMCCGKTRDDAAGEVFDKVARRLSLGYPGGPLIEQHAKTGNDLAFKLPIAMKHSPFEFSFSGLKTATLDCIQSLDNPQEQLADICASFQKTVNDTLVLKTLAACQHYTIQDLVIGGGVASNQTLMNVFKSRISAMSLNLIHIQPNLCTDNAAMIGLAATHLGNIYQLRKDDILVQSTFSYEH
ncbi:tRNA (adenosine(37)-N6)-threonylcarbamoyltransferase complex transferase subunit TsaD [Candidatus Marinamargulisbacteria bacterium SCGC AG-333-B06]|nr:tRNA (adenosine(37)-N6)-threonylcarbamoyltransferase complex transferase subunit TsaD [Candidatus Marinamargulisbacteria bacterium SCGC AG-333-B06]